MYNQRVLTVVEYFALDARSVFNTLRSVIAIRIIELPLCKGVFRGFEGELTKRSVALCPVIGDLQYSDRYKLGISRLPSLMRTTLAAK